jgi:DNA-binding transcriptional MerR regulator
MQDWHSANEITKRSGLSGSTARRYFTTFQAFFKVQTSGKYQRYHISGVDTLQRIAKLYEAKKSTDEIKNILQSELEFMVIDITDHDQPSQATTIINQMEAQTSALLNALQIITDNMAEILKENRENRNEIQELRERVIELEKQIVEGKTKQERKWWQMFTR